MTTGPAVEIDSGKLWSAISYRLFRTEKSAAEVADVLGFAPQVFTDLKAAGSNRGRPGRRPYQPGSAIFLTICWWLGQDPRDFQRVRRPDAFPAGEADLVLMEQ
jgi:hypothetical protein